MFKKLFLTAALAAAGFFAAAPAQAAQSDPIVIYFSATGTTKACAENLAAAAGADLFRIEPKERYTSKDLNWNDKQSRSTVEMNDEKARPAIAAMPDLSGRKVVFLGYPIWWGVAPRIINTFLDGATLKGLTVIPFCTSGGSGLGRSGEILAEAYPAAHWLKGRQLSRGDSEADLKGWAADILKQAAGK